MDLWDLIQKCASLAVEGLHVTHWEKFDCVNWKDIFSNKNSQCSVIANIWLANFNSVQRNYVLIQLSGNMLYAGKEGELNTDKKNHRTKLDKCTFLTC